MKNETESGIKELFSEEIEGIVYLLENPEIFDEFSLFTKKQREWINETFRNLTPEGGQAKKYASYKLSPKKRTELTKDIDKNKNFKSRVKWKAIKETQDLVRISWINRAYDDDALQDIFPLPAIAFLVQTVVMRFGFEYATTLASAIENGMLIYQRRAFRDIPDLYEVSVPVMTRYKSEVAGRLKSELWKEAFERLEKKESGKQE